MREGGNIGEAAFPLRVGILVDSLIQPAWVHRVIQDINESSVADLALVIRNGSHLEPSILKLAVVYRRQLLPLLYDQLDLRLARSRRRPDAFARSSIELVADVPVLNVATIQKKYSDYLPDQDIEAILGHDLDVALRFGFRILRGRALDIARHGIWSYHHADNLQIRGGPNSFWEVMQARPVTGSVLQVLTENLDAGKVIYRSFSPTNPLSLSLNRNPHYWKSSAFVARKLRQVYEQGPSALEQESPAGDAQGPTYQAYSQRIYRRPGNAASIPLLVRLGARLVGGVGMAALTEERSFLACRISPTETEMQTAFHNFSLPPTHPDYSVSAPFPIQHQGQWFVFHETYHHSSGYRSIAVAELRDGRLSGVGIAIEGLSGRRYPCVFHWRGEYYMLSEHAGRGDLQLFRARGFPSEWEPETAILKNVVAAHPTVAEIEGRWWLFVNLALEGASTSDELHLYTADTPLGPWAPLPGNPVKSDARSARPAGGVFHWRGRYYRPAQDCSRLGGYAISINQILRIDAGGYSEREVSRVEPRWRKGLIATRTLNHCGPLTCIDGVIRKPKMLARLFHTTTTARRPTPVEHR